MFDDKKACFIIFGTFLSKWHIQLSISVLFQWVGFCLMGKKKQNFEIFLAFVIVPILRFYLTITWGAAARTARVATIVNRVKVIKQRRSRTMAANFQSLSIALLSSSSRILSVITFISLRMRLSSLGTPLG